MSCELKFGWEAPNYRGMYSGFRGGPLRKTYDFGPGLA